MVHLHQQYARQGFQVMAFPCNQFGDGNTYEPDPNSVVQAFAEERLQTFSSVGGRPPQMFPLFAKSTVKAPMCSPGVNDKGVPTGCRPESVECCAANNGVYDFIHAQMPGDVTWNFDKYLIGRDGSVLNHYVAGTGVDDCGPTWAGCTEGLRRDIEQALTPTVRSPPRFSTSSSTHSFLGYLLSVTLRLFPLNFRLYVGRVGGFSL